MCEATGWKATLMVGVPLPSAEGCIHVIGVHSGKTSQPIHMDFGHFFANATPLKNARQLDTQGVDVIGLDQVEGGDPSHDEAGETHGPGDASGDQNTAGERDAGSGDKGKTAEEPEKEPAVEAEKDSAPSDNPGPSSSVAPSPLISAHPSLGVTLTPHRTPTTPLSATSSAPQSTLPASTSSTRRSQAPATLSVPVPVPVPHPTSLSLSLAPSPLPPLRPTESSTDSHRPVPPAAQSLPALVGESPITRKHKLSPGKKASTLASSQLNTVSPSKPASSNHKQRKGAPQTSNSLSTAKRTPASSAKAPPPARF
ncbi:hypothetical protein CVT24_002095 [Panaeolus cyanescens]|uniref:Uncharacterized protein n=1 Tax=Panaeolus cyanescens TaxID=181874 RepID=A0A409YI97_9AGAR|nr:hypothetical protein CVT24_002095 [Panaeolus cyanescens]